MAPTSDEGTVVFASVGRSHFAFDVFSLDLYSLQEHRLTDGVSVNFNASFVNDPVALDLARSNNSPFKSHHPDQHQQQQQQQLITPPLEGGEPALVYVSERTGTSSIYLNDLVNPGGARVLGPLDHVHAENGFYYCDRPQVANGQVIFTSTNTANHGSNHLTLRKPTTGVFSTCLRSGKTTRLTPDGVADYSPALSPSKEWLMVASNGGEDWEGEIHHLNVGLWVFKPEDGSGRRLIVENGGWPTWSDDTTVYFHKKSPEDDWWSIYKVVLPSNIEDIHQPLTPERVTPPGVHCFTPAASTLSSWIAVATRRPSSPCRHIELFDLTKGAFVPVTLELHPDHHHFNPFVSATSDTLIGYHRSRKTSDDKETVVPLLHHVTSPLEHVSLLRIDGAFPSISPDGSLIAYNTDFEAEDSGVMVARLDGSCRKRICKALAFGTCWSSKTPGVVYTGFGHIFAEETVTVHVISLTFNVEEIASSTEAMLDASMRVLTKPGTNNNAFPCSSPDGKEIVFRSGRSGNKNLYIMDAEHGEEGGIRALTEGPWVDTMPSWSPDGEWIAFSSTRDDPSRVNFAIYMVRPDGSELHRVLPPPSEGGGKPVKGRFNHVCFSPDSKLLLFTADSCGLSAETISVANQFQPYGELFSCRLDGSELLRWTHNAYEDGTPCWGPVRIDPRDLSEEGQELKSQFQDCLWLDTVTDKMKQAGEVKARE